MEIREYLLENGDNPYRSWLKSLDRLIQARIQARIFRFESGNLGDAKSVGDGVHEARFFFGSGYRLYFGIEGKKIIILLVGGDKKTQSRDIIRAKTYLKDYLGRSNAKKK
jgi:putative addiction module killer protein